MAVRDLIIVGAGPAGLAVAIAARDAGLDYQVLEKGVLVNSIFHFPPQMTFFTTPDLLEIGGLPFVTPYEKPTRHEALRYYRRVVDSRQLAIAFGEHVLSIEREDEGGEQVFAIETKSDRGVRRARHARNVALAIGYYDHPNRLGVPGEDLPHVSHYYGDPHAHYQQRVVIVGGKNSAAIAALELYRAGAQVTIVHRQPTLSDRIKYLDPPGHRQPHQGRLGPRAVQHGREGDQADLGRGDAAFPRRCLGIRGSASSRRGATPDRLPP